VAKRFCVSPIQSQEARSCRAGEKLPSMMTATCCGNDARASALKCEVAELILLVRRLREFSEMKNKTSGNLLLTNVSFLIHSIADES